MLHFLVPGTATVFRIRFWCRSPQMNTIPTGSGSATQNEFTLYGSFFWVSITCDSYIRIYYTSLFIQWDIANRCKKNWKKAPNFLNYGVLGLFQRVEVYPYFPYNTVTGTLQKEAWETVERYIFLCYHMFFYILKQKVGLIITNSEKYSYCFDNSSFRAWFRIRIQIFCWIRIWTIVYTLARIQNLLSPGSRS